ncbi:hypothetical protein EDB80DRAFT_751735 [Ilyonectria destructans]|nr:hypothetical protein EDB80DRAFT_751735 [Ilyonectria destructans]
MNSQSTAAGKRRQRSSIACNTCRAKRIRCDGNHPTCATCEASQQKGEYTSKESNRKPPSKRYVTALLERIKVLENQLGETHHQVVSINDKSFQPFEGAEANSDSESSSEELTDGDREPVRELTDRLGRLSVGKDGESRAMAVVDQLNFRITLSDELQNHLLDLYWRWQNPWQYLVVKEAFLRDLYVDDAGRFSSPLLLSAILALAARYSDRLELRTDPADANTAGDALAEQAKLLLLYESESPRITTVQAAAILSLRETAKDKEALGWAYCGMVSRMGFNLGLHLDRSRWVKAEMSSGGDAKLLTSKPS